MARPKKQTVDYFPHMATSGKTLFILENTFGNDGYAFWFKLLELLAKSEGHVFDTKTVAEWKFLVAKTLVTEVKATEILNMLADLEAIDSELWKEKIIWCQNLVDNVEDVYLKRRAKKPAKPIIENNCDENQNSDDVSDTETNANTSSDDVSDSENPQSKVKETKVNKTKVTTTGSGVSPSQEFNALQEFEKLWLFPNEVQREMLYEMIDDSGNELVSAAIRLAGANDVIKGKAINFLKAVLKEWSENKVETLDQVEAYQAKRNQKYKKPYSKPAGKSESLPDWANEENKGEEIDEEKDAEFKARLKRIRSRRKVNQEG
ncbi:DnaD domain protein [Marinilactibacillus psychrotolerans]|uniref:DnaD domain protein n=1 Tax=Marinilactibacillus psychrotolerans TaxID=191770 RepID=UPI00388386DF